MYTIYLTYCINDTKYKRIVKKYPYKIQCVIWLYLHGWIFEGIDDYTNEYVCFTTCPSYPDAKVEIVKEGNLE